MPDTIILIAIFVLLFAGFVVIFRTLRSHRDAGKNDQSLLMLQSQINEVNRMLDTRLTESSQAMQNHLGQSVHLIREIGEKLGRVDEGQKQVLGVTEQLQQLQTILKNPKQRGVLGEYFLEATLKNVLPPTGYKIQYSFPNGTIVDAAIFCDDKIIPVDSKFSLENYNRMIAAGSDAERTQHETALYNDLKRRIDETAKYIPAAEGAADVALMYIPSEGIFYDLVVNSVGTVSSRSLLDYAAEKRVTIVSPTLFYVFLQTILQVLRQHQFNKSAEQIRKKVTELSHHLVNYETFMKKLGQHLGTSVGMYNNAYKEFHKIDKDVMKISGEAMGIEPVALETPSQTDES